MSNLPATNKVAEVRSLLEKYKPQFGQVLPKHLTADRLLRVAMGSISKNPKLLQCTQSSLLSCVMTCAQLGLEPDQFLGQAYLIPFKNTKKNAYECQIIPGYRGYISLARRTGEVQTLSAQVVYSNDSLRLQYGTEDRLEHLPELNGDRGKPVGAYCVIRYKDGAYSFDFMSTGDIEKIRKRSKSANDGPWVTDWDEMAKKTIIRRHIKLAPLSIEFQTAAALEDRAMSGESQADLMGLEGDDDNTVDIEPEGAEDKDAILKQFAASVTADIDPELLGPFLDGIAKTEGCTVNEVKIAAMKQPTAFWSAFEKYSAKNKKSDPPPAPEPEHEERHSCPLGGFVTPSFCQTCEHKVDKQGEKCPAAV